MFILLTSGMTIRYAGVIFWHDYKRSGTLTFKVKIAGLSRIHNSNNNNNKHTFFQVTIRVNQLILGYVVSEILEVREMCDYIGAIRHGIKIVTTAVTWHADGGYNYQRIVNLILLVFSR